MPVFVIACPECGRVAKTLVLDGCRMPVEWICGHCKGRSVAPDLVMVESHPWEEGHGSGCPCCRPAVASAPACAAIDG